MEIISNEEVIAINQDPSDTAGDRIAKRADGSQVWSRDLYNGDKCVVLYNSGNGGKSKTAVTVGLTWDMIGWANSNSVEIRDLWRKKTLGKFTGGYNATINARDVQMLRIKKL